MSEPAVVDAEVVPESASTEVVEREPGRAIFKTEDPMEIMQKTTEVASALKEFIGAQGLMSNIQGRDYIVVEGWQMLGMMLGVTPVVRETRAVEHGWEAVVELHDKTGRVVGSGEAECLDTERTWKSRDDYARRSMAQTRAIGKAFRNTFGFIAKAAGFEATPAEEMPQPNGNRGLEFGKEGSVKQIEQTRNAFAYLLDTEPDAKAVTEALDAVRRDAGYLPRISLIAVIRAATAVKVMRGEES